MRNNITIRPVTEADVPEIGAIYTHYVLHGLATFEIDPPTVVEMERRRCDLERHGFPYLAAELNGAVVGYAYASPYRPRKAYRYTMEDSIYIHPGYTGKGIGSVLLPALIASCERMGARQLIAVIGGSDNRASMRLHERFGFAYAGTLRSVGFKFGQWVDTVLMQRAAGSGL